MCVLTSLILACLGPSGAGVFDAQVRIGANGTPIDVTAGHAARYLCDWDGDGVRDLLVGDFGAIFRKIHEQTPQEKAEIARLEVETEELGTQRMPLWNAQDPLTTEQEQRMSQLDKKLRANHERIESMRTHDTNWHGGVWLYRQQSPTTAQAP